MTARQATGRLIERLPAVRGKLRAAVSLAEMTWFRVGGPAEVLFHPADRADLIAFLQAKPADVPITVIGVGSNLLVRDGGVDGVVVRLGRGFAGVEIDGAKVRAGGATADVNIAVICRDKGVGGLEFLRGIPGTIGGAIAMNAGAYGREIADVLVAAQAVDGGGVLHQVPADQLGLSYRHSTAPAGWIFTEATLQGRVDNPAAIARRMTDVGEARRTSQPVTTRTGGSTFKNPPDANAWQLIDAAGCRGLKRGGAQVSELHCNFLINTGDASAADLEALGEEVRRRVQASSGITLEWEIRRLGRHGDRPVRGAP